MLLFSKIFGYVISFSYLCNQVENKLLTLKSAHEKLIVHKNMATGKYTQDDIKNKTYEVTILQKGIDGDTLCFKLYNEELGEFIINNCHYNIEPAYFQNIIHCLNGKAEITIDGKNVSFSAALMFCSLVSDRGAVTLIC